VDSSALDPNELAAIRAAIAPAASPSRSASPEENPDASPIALIADDRAAESARPNGLRIGTRWATSSRSTLLRVSGAKCEIDVLAADTVDGSALRDELASAWLRCIAVTGRRGTAMIAVSGAMIEALAACQLGATMESATATPRPTPSATSLRIFTPVGEALVGALGTAWNDEQSAEVQPQGGAQAADAWRRELGDGDLVVVLTLEVKGSLSGVIRLIARPELLVQPAARVDAVPAPRGAIEEALGEVPVELRVELGRLKMTMAELAALQPGTVLPMSKFIDDPLPVRVGGRLKAWGRAMVARGVVAVEILGIESGSKPNEK
jgi:flagellar motor switch protein FliM